MASTPEESAKVPAAAKSVPTPAAAAKSGPTPAATATTVFMPTKPKYGDIIEVLGKGLYDPEVFSNLTFDTLRRYNNRHASLLKSDLTAACYAVMTPKGELIKIMKQVDRDAPSLKPNAFLPKETPLQREGSHYGRLVVDQHNKQRDHYMDDLALQILDAVMASADPPSALTKFICNVEARVFASMQSAPPQELNETYGLPKEGRPDKET